MYRFLAAIFVLMFLPPLTVSGEWRLARVEGSRLLLVTLASDGRVRTTQTCSPEFPAGTKVYFTEVGKGLLVERGATNNVSPEFSGIVSSLKSTYGLDFTAIPQFMLNGEVEYAVCNAAGNRLAVLMVGRGHLHILDNESRVVGTIEGKGIQKPSWSCVSDTLAFWQRGADPNPWADDFGLRIARLTKRGVTVVEVSAPSGSMETRKEREPPIWSAMVDTFWCDPYKDYQPQSHLISVGLTAITTNALPTSHRVFGSIPRSPNWYLHGAVKETVSLASSTGQPILSLGGNRWLWKGIATNLFLTSERRKIPPDVLHISKPGWNDVGTIPYGTYWLIDGGE